MDPMLMAIIAVIIVVILAGIFFMKSRGKTTKTTTPSTTPTTTKATNRPKTLAEQQREMATTPTPTVVSKPEVNHLAIAQQYFDQRDYSNAVASLTSAIATQPDRADLQLLLLKSYAEQKNYAEFDKVYNNLTQLNDPSASDQASRLKHLLDEEQAFALNPVVAPATNTISDGLDFDDFSFDNTPVTPTSKPVAVEEEVFSFDDLETQVLTDAQPNTQATSATIEEPSFDFDLDTSLDTSVSSSKTEAVTDKAFPELTDDITSVTAPVHTTEADNTFDFDALSLDTSVADTVPTAKPVVDETEAFDFDFEEKPTTSKEAAHSYNSSDNVTEFEDFDLSFDAEPKAMDKIENSSSTEQTMPISSKESFSFDMNEPVSDDLSTTQPPKEQVMDDFEFDLSEDIDIAPDVTADVKNPAEFDSAVLNAKAPAQPSQEVSFDFDKDSMIEHDTLNQLEALYAPKAPESTAPTVDSLDFNNLDTVADTSPNITVAPSRATITAPAVSEMSEADLDQAFAIIKDMDTTQLNLDLAGQYIELGEYDSAKRLLNEISNANPDQQSIVNNLLEKIG